MRSRLNEQFALKPRSKNDFRDDYVYSDGQGNSESSSEEETESCMPQKRTASGKSKKQLKKSEIQR